jgi:thioredoxin-related protein
MVSTQQFRKGIKLFSFFILITVVNPLNLFALNKSSTHDSLNIVDEKPNFKVQKWSNKKFLNQPEFSNSWIDTSLPSFYMLLSPDCKHCFQIAAQLKAHANLFNSINVVILTLPYPEDLVDSFFQKIDLPQHLPNWHLGIDIEFLFGSKYQANNTPFIIVFDKHQKYLQSIPRIKDINELIGILNKEN